MKVLIISDTHGQLDSRIACLARSCDIAIHAGDIMSAQVLDQLSPRTGRVYAVRGNNDIATRLKPRDRRLSRLPEQQTVELPGGRLCVVHGHQIWDTANYHARLRKKYGDVRVIVYGHTHHQVQDLDADPWVLNPGAAGRTRTHGGPSCLILNASRRSWSVRSSRFALDRR